MAISVSPPVPIDQRFAQLIKQFGLTKNSFAMSLGKTASVVQHLIDGRNKPGYDLLCKVFEIYPNVSRDWLLLGRGPMLVSGEPTPKAIAPIAIAPIPEPPLEPIDLSDVELPAHRRPAPGVAGTRLQPAEIAATLALAAAAAQPARTSSATVSVAPETPLAADIPASGGDVGIPAPTIPPASATPPTQVPVPDPVPVAEVLSAPTTSVPPPPSMSSTASAPMPAAGVGPETYMAAALHAQHLQHQLALAELRNQHLLEQQQMLREMLAMARQAMV
ncbi:helix-turn-helix transcriptional regulator [Hymenobacter rubidus]|uniref:helix-turn-helix transcriptional regulator n=1 Tax=Hymenobacter rubidus TaxID=1441626 RepID=UPI00191EBB30|nr:helix-turn-helix transcriptional regulator [Hymenobacter rubidus]